MPSFMVKQATSRAVQPMMPMTVVSMRPLVAEHVLDDGARRKAELPVYAPARSKNILPPLDGTSPRNSSVAGSFTRLRAGEEGRGKEHDYTDGCGYERRTPGKDDGCVLEGELRHEDVERHVLDYDDAEQPANEDALARRRRGYRHKVPEKLARREAEAFCAPMSTRCSRMTLVIAAKQTSTDTMRKDHRHCVAQAEMALTMVSSRARRRPRFLPDYPTAFLKLGGSACASANSASPSASSALASSSSASPSATPVRRQPALLRRPRALLWRPQARPWRLQARFSILRASPRQAISDLRPQAGLRGFVFLGMAATAARPARHSPRV